MILVRFSCCDIQKLVLSCLAAILLDPLSLISGEIWKERHNFDGPPQGLRRSLLHGSRLHDEHLSMFVEKAQPQTFGHQTHLDLQRETLEIAPLHKISVL